MTENPFNPGFGKIPGIFIDREDAVSKVVEGLSNLNSPWQTTVICGVRGVGKTALLTDVCRKLEEKDGWIVSDVPSNGEILQTVVQSLYEKASLAVRKAIDRIEGFTVSLFGVGVGYTAEKPKVNYQLLLEKMLKTLQEKKITLLVAIDEVNASAEMRRFVSIYQIMLRKDYPIAMVMT